MKKLEQLKLSDGWESFLAYRDRKLRGVQTGIRSLDAMTLGLGALTIIQGAPGTNKSTLALQIAHHNALLGSPALILDRENGRERFRMRLLCQSNKVSQLTAMTCSRDQLREYVRKILDLPLYACIDVVDDPEELAPLVAELVALSPKPAILVVDSLQALPLVDGDERLSLNSWMKAFDQLKLDYEGRLTTLVTSEKKRGTDEYNRASLSAAKGSGGVEYKAEMVLDLRRDHKSGQLICEIVKNRDGQSGVSVVLAPQLAVPTNPQSFTFSLVEGSLVEDDL